MERKNIKPILTVLSSVIICVLAVIAACIAFIPSTRKAGAEGEVSTWDGNLIAAGWGDTDGNKTPAPAEYVLDEDNHTLQLGSAAAFAYFSHEVYLAENGGFADYTVTLTTDVDLDDHMWMPIGFDHRKQESKHLNHSFKGTFDGGNHTISNFDATEFLNAITYNNSGEYRVVANGVDELLFLDDNEFHYGLFGAIGDSTIKNLIVSDFKFDFAAVKEEKNDENIDVLIADSIGAIAGFSGGTLVVENCQAGTAKTDTVDVRGVAVVGGIVGRANSGYNSANGQYVNGGDKEVYCDVTFTNCVNYLNLGAESGNDVAQKGGIVGYATPCKTLIFTDCANYGNLYGEYTGGMTAFTQQTNQADKVSFVNCRNEGNLTATSFCNGGIIGRSSTGEILEFINCVNTGTIWTKENPALASGDTNHQFTGGIVGQINEHSVTRDFKIDGLYNYGRIIGAGKNESSAALPKSYAGGLIGDARITVPSDGTNGVTYTWINNGRKEEDYPYKTLIMHNLVNLGEVTAEGNYHGKFMFIGGLFGALSTNRDNNANIMRVSAKNFVNAYGAVNAIDYLGNIDNDSKGSALRRDIGTFEVVTEITTAQLVLSEDGKTVLGIDGEATGAVKVVIPNTVTAIADNAFSGLGTLLDKGYSTPVQSVPNPIAYQRLFQVNTAKLAAIEFEEGSKLQTIGELAFAGTDLTEIALPASVKSIGNGAFADTKLERVVLSSSDLVIGDMAFGNNASLKQVELGNGNIEYGDNVFVQYDGDEPVIIAANATKYGELVEADFAKYTTYPVTIKYFELSSNTELAQSEQKLYGKPYTVAYDEETKLWADANIGYVGLSGDGVQWHSVSNLTNLLDVNAATALLGSAELLNSATPDEVYFYTRSLGDSGVDYVALNNLVYDGKSYSVYSINSLLAPNSKRVSDTAEITIKSYNGNEENAPTEICDAGSYVVTITDGADVADITIVIAKATINLASPAAFEWRVNNNISMLDRTVYLYNMTEGEGKYPSLSVLDGMAIEGVDTSAYTTVNIVDSVVRSRGIDLTLNLAENGYTVAPANNVVADSAVGVYVSTFTVTADGNHELALNGAIVNKDARAIDIELEGGVATVTKTWYVVDMQNWFGTIDNDYAIANRVYGSNAQFVAPMLYHGGADDLAKVTYELYRNGTPVGAAAFGAEDFTKYFNARIPVGNYTLVMNAPELTYDEYDYGDNGEVTATYTFTCAAFSQDVNFAVTPATFNATQVANIHTALNTKKFEFVVGNSTMTGDNLAVYNTVSNTYLAALATAQPSTSVAGNVWTLDNPTIEVNRAASLTNSYGAFTRPESAGVYNYYYRIVSDNYDVVDSTNAGLLSFTVVAYNTVAVPTVESKVYNGTVQTADIMGSADYSVTANAGGTNAGNYAVTLTLTHPEYTLWATDTLADKTADKQLTFTIAQAENVFDVSLNMLGWSFESFDVAVNNIRALVRFLDPGKTVHFRVVVKDEIEPVEGLRDFTIDSNGRVSAVVAAALNSLRAAEYTLYATVEETNNYKALEHSINFSVSKSINRWADGEGDLVLPSWVVGEYDAAVNEIMVKAEHGDVKISIADIDGKEYYNSVTGLNKLNDCAVGKYLLKAWVDETDDFAALAERTFTIEVLDKIGLPWWGTLLIVIGALALAAIIFIILWKAGVFTFLTDKIILALRLRASVDATIASVRAAKRMEEGKKTVAAAKRKEAAAARAEARKAEKALPEEERAAALEAKAQQTVEKAEKMRARMEAMQKLAERMREQAKQMTEGSKEAPAAEAAATEAPTAETPKTEEPQTEAEAPAVEAEAPAEAPKPKKKKSTPKAKAPNAEAETEAAATEATETPAEE